jgi:GT2 family glycosyltransferase
MTHSPLPVKTPISVVIPYNNNDIGLIYTLTMLQNQTVPPQEIIVIDTSKTKRGYEIVKQYSYNSIPITVECAKVHVYSAWNKGIELSDKNNHVFIINDDLVFPINTLQIMTYALENIEAYAHVPKTVSRRYSADTISIEFDPVCSSKIHMVETDWLPGFCFLLTRSCINDIGLFNDKTYSIWFGDTDYENRIKSQAEYTDIRGINKINGLFVYHFGGKSYDYAKKEVSTLVDQDRTKFEKSNKDKI